MLSKNKKFWYGIEFHNLITIKKRECIQSKWKKYYRNRYNSLNSMNDFLNCCIWSSQNSKNNNLFRNKKKHWQQQWNMKWETIQNNRTSYKNGQIRYIPNFNKNKHKLNNMLKLIWPLRKLRNSPNKQHYDGKTIDHLSNKSNKS